jgi:hypothetical protein
VAEGNPTCARIFLISLACTTKAINFIPPSQCQKCKGAVLYIRTISEFKDNPILKDAGYNVVVDAPILYLDGPDHKVYIQRVYKKETSL